ncbi:MAG: DNA polymerase III subunit delta [Burkholderiales bacterium]|jgi:DNA polymerase-3 subunit delta|nr:DNA polymerase III subunit delta [Burkholderiales bacterium]
MQIRFEELEKRLTEKLIPLYLIHGDEPLFIQEAGDAIRAAARRAGCAEREIFVVEQGFKWDGLRIAHSNLGLFSERRLIDLRIPSGKPGVEGAKVLENYAQTLDDQQVTMITLPRADRVMQATAWFKALSAVAAVIPVYPLEREALPRWIEARLEKLGLRVTADALALLTTYSEGNLLAARQEIEKLALLFPEGRLDVTQVESAITDVARYDVLALSEAWLSGDVTRALRLLYALKEEGETPTLLAWQFAEDVHALCAVRAQTMKGAPLAQAVREARIWGKRQAAMEKAARRVSNADLPILLNMLAKLDALAKGLFPTSAYGDFWQTLTHLALRLCGANVAARQRYHV